MHPYLSRPHYRRLFVQRREAALDELPLMFEGLWPEAPDELLLEAQQDMEWAGSVGEVTAILRSWAHLLHEQPLDPDIEARSTLIPLLAEWTLGQKEGFGP